MPDDADLRAAFASLRRDEAARAPTRARILAGARARPATGHRWALAAAPVAALALLALWLLPAGRVDEVAPPPSDAARAPLETLGAWYTATDVLLEPHGWELLRRLPWEEYEDAEPVDELRPTSRITRRMST